MTNGEKIIECFNRAADLQNSGQLAKVLLEIARSDFLYIGDGMYELWCDYQGDCDKCCNDDRTDLDDDCQLACIQRYLDREYSGSP